MNVQFRNDWADFFEKEKEQLYYKQLLSKLGEEYLQETVYPDRHEIFNALHYTPLAETKVIILGQIPITAPDRPTV